MPFDENTDLTPGRLAHATQQTIATLRTDSELVDWLGGDPSAIIDGQGSGDVPSRALAVEGVVNGESVSAQMGRNRLTIQLTPLVSRSVYRAESDRYLRALCDRAVAYLRRTNIGPEYTYLGATDDLSLPEPEAADDIDAVMEDMARVQFSSQIARMP